MVTTNASKNMTDEEKKDMLLKKLSNFAWIRNTSDNGR